MLGNRLLILTLAVAALVFAAVAASAAAQDAVDRALANADVVYLDAVDRAVLNYEAPVPDAVDRAVANVPIVSVGADAIDRVLANRPMSPDAIHRYLASAPESAPALPTATTAPNAFSWTDAGVGAAIALGAIVILLVAGLAIVSYRRHESPWHWGHGHPSM